MRQYLNFDWDYISNFRDEYLNTFPKESEKIDIPHNIENLPYNYFDESIYQKVVTYRKCFDVKEEIIDKIIILRFEAFMLKAKMYLNNHYLGEFVSLYNPIEIDVTKYIKQKDNQLIVVLDAREDKNCPPFGLVVDYLTFGGIYREVSLNLHPKVYLEKVLVSGDEKGNVTIKPLVNLEGKYHLIHQIYQGEKLIKETSDNNFYLNDFKLWDLENPNLYVLKTTLHSQFGESNYQTRFGFRTATFKRNGFYLNGKKIKLVGLNRHQSYPYVGYAMPKSGQEDDANILKFQAGVNICRTSHYPQSEHFLNRCDEIGLLVINEIPGWQHISKEDKWRQQHYKNVESMIKEEFNHPCLIAHGVRIDESQDDFELYKKSNDIAHQLDPTRQTLGVRNFKNSEILEDIYAFNDFVCSDLSKGLNNPKKIKTKKHPYLVTEYLGHMEPTKPTDNEKQKVYHALRHAVVLNDNFKYENLCGAIGWCFADYYTHVDFGSGDRICAHGVFDMFRNPKYASKIYLSQQDQIPVLEVLCNMKPGEYPACSFEDIYVASNADYIDLYKGDKYINRFYPDKKRFPHLPHPLFLIDDVIGQSFDDSKFSINDRKKMAKTLSHVAFFGFDKLRIRDKLLIGKCMLKYHLKYSDLVDIYNTYVSSWGGKAKTYTFKGYKNNQLVSEQVIGETHQFNLHIDATKTTLINQETYDVARVSIKYLDEFKNLLSVSTMPLIIESEGEIQALCPKQITLLGGQTSIYVRSLKKGKGKLKIISNNLIKEIEFEIK